MKAAWLMSITIIALVVSASAQPGPDGTRGDRPEMQRERPARPGGPPIQAIIARLPDRLELDDAQREQFDTIAADFLQRWSEMTGQRDELRDLVKQRRQARDAGSDGAAEDLRERMSALRQQRRQIVEEFFGAVEPTLDEQQVATLDQLRKRLRRRSEGGRQRPDRQAMLERLPDALGLDAEQRVQFDDLLARREAARQERRAHWQEMRPLFEQLRAARAAGDEELAAELEAKLQASRPERGGPGEFVAELESILTAEQLIKWEELRQSSDQRASRRGERGPDIREIIRAAKRLDLDSGQRDQLKEIIRDVGRLNRRSHRGQRGSDDRSAFRDRAEQARQIKSRIVAILTPEQQHEFEQLLKRDRGGHRPRDGDRRHSRDRRPDRERPQLPPARIGDD